MTNRLTGTGEITGIVCGACIVTFTGLKDEVEAPRCLTGIVVQDFAGRFSAGNPFVSSLVQAVDGDVVTTLYSKYKVRGGIEEISLPWQASRLVRNFVDPKLIKLIINEARAAE